MPRLTTPSDLVKVRCSTVEKSDIRVFGPLTRQSAEQLVRDLASGGFSYARIEIDDVETG